MTTQTVLITGALTGIGRAAAFAFAEQSTGFIALKRTLEGSLLLSWMPAILGYFIVRYKNRSQK